MNTTIDYYNKNADSFMEGTVNSDMSGQYKRFEKYLSKGARVLDCGCGSGRDTKYFLEHEFDVVAIDGSEELSKKASDYTGIDVKHLYFQDIDFKNEFDGIWACATLLHLTKDELNLVFGKLVESLKIGGVFYVSFKYGEFEGERNGRFFTDLNEAEFEKIVSKFPELAVKDTFITSDVRPGRSDEKWLNVVMMKLFNK